MSNSEFGYLAGLAYDCPKGNERSENCPLIHLEHLNFSEKVKWIKDVNDDHVKNILNKHYECSFNSYCIGLKII